MNLVDDPERYARLQLQVLVNLARVARDCLRRQGLPDETLREAVEELTSQLASTLDEHDVFDGTVLPIRPHLCFGGMGLGKDEVLFGGGAITMSAAVPMAVDELFCE